MLGRIVHQRGSGHAQTNGVSTERGFSHAVALQGKFRASPKIPGAERKVIPRGRGKGERGGLRFGGNPP